MIEFPVILGHEKTIHHFFDARNSGRLHHAWLFEGIKGIGKSLTAKALAGIMLGAGYSQENGQLLLSEDSITDHLKAGSHPDFRIISAPETEPGKQAAIIPAEDVRKISQFFSLKPAMGGYRVAILDAMDDLNTTGANALLKTLEEPPKNCLLFLIYHGTAPLLPTIRSRCQKLKFEKLSTQALHHVMELAEAESELNPALEKFCSGSPGKWKAYQDASVGTLLSSLNSLFGPGWPKPSASQLQTVIQEMSRSEIHFDFGLNYLDAWMLKAASATPQLGQSYLLSNSWTNIRQTAAAGTGLKLDLTERSAKCLSAIQELARKLEPQNAV